MITIYHNPRCSKSRCGLQYLKDKGISPVVVEYLNGQLTEEKLSSLLKKMGKRPMDIIRTHEDAFAPYKASQFSDQEWIRILVDNPRLIERPIVESDDKAVICRPVENIDEVL